MTRLSWMMTLAAFLTAEAGRAEYRDFLVHLPLTPVNDGTLTQVEYNLNGWGGLGLGLRVRDEIDLYTQEESIQNSGDSILTAAQELSLSYGYYTQAENLSGAYWQLGLGYRQVQARWQRTPTEAFAPAGVSLDGNGRFFHVANGSGIVASARLGFRYVGDQLPISIGAFVGARYFHNRFIDGIRDGAVSTPSEDLAFLESRMTAVFEPGIELGLAL